MQPIIALGVEAITVSKTRLALNAKAGLGAGPRVGPADEKESLVSEVIFHNSQCQYTCII